MPFRSPKVDALVDDEALDLLEHRACAVGVMSWRYTRPGAMRRSGGLRPVIARICTGEVWVRRTKPPSTKNVSCMSRAGWSSGRFRAWKLL